MLWNIVYIEKKFTRKFKSNVISIKIILDLKCLKLQRHIYFFYTHSILYLFEYTIYQSSNWWITRIVVTTLCEVEDV